LRRLTNLIPVPAETLAPLNPDARAAATAPGSTISPSTPDAKAATSKTYFQHISLLLDQLREELKGPRISPKIAQRMVDKAALEIDRLPVLNVDEELIAYGTGVSGCLRNMRNLSKNASLDASYRQAAIMGQSGYGYGYGGFYSGGSGALETSVMRN